MFARRLLGLWVHARGLIGLNVVLGLAVTACYAAQGLAVAEIIGQVFRGDRTGRRSCCSRT